MIELEKECVVLSRVEVVEYFDPAGRLTWDTECVDGGGDLLPLGKVLEMLEWCRANQTLPIVAQLMADFVVADDDDE